MPIIGATQLEPVNVVSNYLAGQEMRRNALLQQQEAMRAQQRMELEQRRFQREEDTAAAEAQNALLRRQALATGDPMAMFKAGATREAADYATLMNTQEDQEYTRKKRGLEELSQQAGAFARNPGMLAPEYVDAWAQDALSRNIISPQAYEQLKSTYGNPRAMQGFFTQLRDQGLTVAQQLESDRAARTAAIQEGQLNVSRARLAFDKAEAERKAMQPAEGAKPPVGYRFSAAGDLEFIPGGPADPAVIKRNMEAGRAAPIGSARTSEQERNTAYNTGRLLGSLASISRATTKDASAGAPGVVEAALLSSPFGILEPAANWVRGPQRQIVANAQADMIDALLYLATGAAYNKEQLEAQRQAYLPNFTDKDAARQDKRERLKELIVSAKVRSGNAWTPELEDRFRTFVSGVADPAEDGVLAEADAILRGGQ